MYKNGMGARTLKKNVSMRLSSSVCDALHLDLSNSDMQMTPPISTSTPLQDPFPVLMSYPLHEVESCATAVAMARATAAARSILTTISCSLARQKRGDCTRAQRGCVQREGGGVSELRKVARRRTRSGLQHLWPAAVPTTDNAHHTKYPAPRVREMPDRASSKNAMPMKLSQHSGAG